MFVSRIRTAALALAAGLSLSACVYDGGYGGISVGYGSAGYYDPYYDGYGYGYGRGYGRSPYYGWYDDFYYPGTGYHVYDRYRRPYRWNDRQQRYWIDRRSVYRDWPGGRLRDNWGDFRRERREYREDFRQDRRERHRERRRERRDRRY